MHIFLKVLKIKSELTVGAMMGLWRNFKIKFLLASLKWLSNSKKPSRHPLHEARSGLWLWKLWFWKLFQKSDKTSLYADENRPVRVKESWNRNLMPPSKQSLELVRIFKEESGKLYLFFSLTRQHENLKTNYSCAEGNDLVLWAFKYIFHLMT